MPQAEMYRVGVGGSNLALILFRLARGKNITKLALVSGVSRASIYRLMEHGNINLAALISVLEVLGYELQIVPKEGDDSKPATKAGQCHGDMT